ncbi:hypothetical protein [Bdellovibrio bacteriovorus]|uniref:hypothetical protein n=1 Tax=Bdellovibrio bacteriovorus TaxID=959 RepID=UPI003AA97DAC
MPKWYGKIIYDNEGCVDFIESESKEVAQAYVDGFKRAKEEIEAGGEGDPLEDYWTSVDQIKPTEES